MSFITDEEIKDLTKKIVAKFIYDVLQPGVGTTIEDAWRQWDDSWQKELKVIMLYNTYNILRDKFNEKQANNKKLEIDFSDIKS